MSDAKRWGVWGGRPPGGWCHSTRFADPAHPYWGTRDEAEQTLAVFNAENPDVSYEVVPFDPEREPEPWPCRVTLVQLRALADIATEGQGAQHAPVSRGGFGKATFTALMERGLVMDNLGGRPILKITRAGRAVLAKQQYMLGKK